MAEDTQKEIGPEEEIKELERKLEEKKRELAQQGETVPEEKEVFREILRKHIEGARPVLPKAPLSVTSPVKHTLADDLKKKNDDIKKQEVVEEQVKALIEIALTKTIAEAIKMAEAINPYLLDELHDRLVDDYYDKLLALRKLQPL